MIGFDLNDATPDMNSARGLIGKERAIAIGHFQQNTEKANLPLSVAADNLIAILKLADM